MPDFGSSFSGWANGRKLKDAELILLHKLAPAEQKFYEKGPKKSKK